MSLNENIDCSQQFEFFWVFKTACMWRHITRCSISDNWNDWFAGMLDQKVESLQIPMQDTKCLRTVCGDVGLTNPYKWIESFTQ